MKIINRSSINKKFILLLTGFILVLSLASVFLYFSFSSMLKREKQIQIELLTKSLVDFVETIYELEDTGKITQEQAKTYALEKLFNAKYSDNGYYWVNNISGDIVMHPFEHDLLLENQLNLQDYKGKFFIQEIIKHAQNNTGWTEYVWTKPNKEKLYNKLAYGVLFEPWEWLIVTGIYIDELNKATFLLMLHSSGFILAILLIFVIFMIFFGRNLVKDLNDIAIRDNLTGLYSKLFFDETIQIYLKRHKRNPQLFLAVFFLDIDHFKKINDTFGHAVGDIVLKKIGKALLSNSRTEDLCARYGGEEFLITGFFNSLEEVETYAKRIKDAIENIKFSYRKQNFKTTISIGIAAHKADCTIEKTIKAADKQLYKAKANGRNRIEIDKSLATIQTS